MRKITLAIALALSTNIKAEDLLKNVNKNSIFQIKANELKIPANSVQTLVAHVPFGKPTASAQHYIDCYLLYTRSDSSMRLTPQTKLKIVRTLTDEIYPATGQDSPFSSFIRGSQAVVIDIALVTASGQRFALECGHLIFNPADKSWIISEKSAWTDHARTKILENHLSLTPGEDIVVE